MYTLYKKYIFMKITCNNLCNKTKEDIPKGKIFDCVKALKGIEVPAPVHIGDVILKNVADTGVDIVATKNVE